MEHTMTNTTLPSIGLAYRWLLAYYEDIAKFCRRVRDEFAAHGHASYPSTDSIEVRSSKALTLTENWLPCYHYQFFESRIPESPGIELERVAFLCVGVDHFDRRTPTRAEPVVYLARFGLILPEDRARLKGEIVYHWDAQEWSAPTWCEGTFRSVPYTYRTLPLSEIATLDDVVPKIVEPLLEHDRGRRAALGIASP
jgi:hypothetical protein